MTVHPPMAVVVPALVGRPDRLLASLRQQSLSPAEVEVVTGVGPSGRARNIGVERTTAPVVVFVDDDAVLAHEHVLANLVAPLTRDPQIAVSGAARILPPGSSRFQRLVARQVPRVEHATVSETVAADPPVATFGHTAVTTTCCAVRRSALDDVGGFDETMVRGVDTELFHRMARRGYRFVLAADACVYHPAPASWRALVTKHFLYGVGYSQEVRRHPERAAGRLLASPVHAVAYLLLRTVLVAPHCFVDYSLSAPNLRFRLRPLGALASYAAALGYVYGWYRYGPPSRPAAEVRGSRRGRIPRGREP